jgi:hypothetical protein
MVRVRGHFAYQRFNAKRATEVGMVWDGLGLAGVDDDRPPSNSDERIMP